MREPETVEDFMRKVSVLKGCGEQSASCTSNPEKCECWRSASTGARLLRSALDKPEDHPHAVRGVGVWRMA